ncbi:MAG: hypothetical protein RLY93_03645 [Sumerlaeia bacterium]
MTTLPATSRRVPEHTRDSLNARIEANTERSIQFYARHPELIDHRLEELDREWDTERTLEANASTLMLAGTAMGLMGHRRALILPLAVSGFLLQHALQGWCPPLAVLRRLGVRTMREIDEERAALLEMRAAF